MSTFFSGTDTATLKEEGRDRNNFVSLIVNNAGTYTAAITRRLKNKTVKELVSYEFFGEGLREEELEYESTADIIEWFYLKIEKEKEDCSFSDMEARLEEIKKVKASKPSIPTTNPVPPSLTYSKDVPKTPKVPTTNKTTEYKDLFGIDYGHIQVNKELIKSLVLQIATGSILMSKESKLDIDKWINNMPSMYEKRFGKGHEGFSLFQMWADVYTEFITWYIVDHRLENEGLDQTEIQSIYAFYIIDALKKLPHNIYLKEYIEALEKYII